MSKKAKRKAELKTVEQQSGPWISMRTGLIVIAITSIAMAVLTAWQAIPAKGVVDGILLGILFGGLIWVVFFGFILFNRWIR